jgi:hypothetical protein
VRTLLLHRASRTTTTTNTNSITHTITDIKTNKQTGPPPLQRRTSARAAAAEAKTTANAAPPRGQPTLTDVGNLLGLMRQPWLLGDASTRTRVPSAVRATYIGATVTRWESSGSFAYARVLEVNTVMHKLRGTDTSLPRDVWTLSPQRGPNGNLFGDNFTIDWATLRKYAIVK